MGTFGFRELVVILVIVLLLFGAKRLPSIMGDLARGFKSFKDGLKDEPAKPVDDKTNQPPSPPQG